MNIKHLLYDYLVSTGLSNTTAKYANMLALLLVLLIAAFIIDFIVRRILVELFTRFATKSKTNFDDLLVQNKTPKNIAHIFPLLARIIPYLRSYLSNIDSLPKTPP